MNSMNKFVEEIKSKFEILSADYPDSMQIALDIKNNEVHSLLSHLKSIGFGQLSIISCIDWIKDNKFELVYILMNWETGIHILVRTKLERENPVFRTITNIYPGAQYYERDIHEFFGVEFEGNEMSYKQLFLELWDDIPPMRKDFDSLAYAEKTFPEREYKPKFNSGVGVFK